MSKKYLGNAFSLGMLDFVSGNITGNIQVVALSPERAKEWVGANAPESIVGHADTAEFLSAKLGVNVEMRRVSTSMQPGDQLLVAQYNGPRLPEGAKSLPEGAKIRWFLLLLE